MNSCRHDQVVVILQQRYDDVVMNETTEGQGANVNRDRFLSCFAAAATCGIVLITLGWAAHFAFGPAPSLQQLAHDFGMSLPLATEISLRHSKIPPATAVVALITGIACWARPRRTILVAAAVLTLPAMGLTVATEIVARWPVGQVLRSVHSFEVDPSGREATTSIGYPATAVIGL